MCTVDAEFCKPWMPYFCRSGHPVLTVNQFLRFVDPFLPQEPVLDLPRITRLVDFTGGPGMRLRLCLLPGSRSWQFCLVWWKLLVPSQGGRGLYSLGSASFVCVLPVMNTLWASLRLTYLRDWVEGSVPQFVFSLGVVSLRCAGF